MVAGGFYNHRLVLGSGARRSAGAHPVLVTPEHTARARDLIGPDGAVDLAAFRPRDASSRGLGQWLWRQVTALAVKPDDITELARARASEWLGGKVEDLAVAGASTLGAKAIVESGLVRLTSDTQGTASKVEVLGGTAAAALGFPGAPAVGTGNVASVRATLIAEVLALAAGLAGAVPSATPAGALSLRTVASAVVELLRFEGSRRSAEISTTAGRSTMNCIHCVTL